jgi:hypothetical protein
MPTRNPFAHVQPSCPRATLMPTRNPHAHAQPSCPHAIPMPTRNRHAHAQHPPTPLRPRTTPTHTPTPSHNARAYLHIHTRPSHTCTPHLITLPLVSHASTNQLNKRLEEMAAALARVPSSNQTRPPGSSKTKPGRYQPYSTGPATDSTNRLDDGNPRSSRVASANKRGKVGHLPSGANDQGFTAGTDIRGLSACAICLGRNPHDVTQCNASTLWDRHTPAFSR